MASNIERIHGPASGRSTVSVFAGLVYAVAYDPDMAEGIVAQTKNTLQFLDDHLTKAGSNKSAILQVTIYLRNISQKAEMDVVWNQWIGPKEDWPQRACVGADLADDTLIEVVVIAAQTEQ